MEIITTHTEPEALLLEANLIKRLKPHYNIVLRDDKSHPYILLTGDHAWPQLVKHRGARRRERPPAGTHTPAQCLPGCRSPARRPSLRRWLVCARLAIAERSRARSRGASGRQCEAVSTTRSRRACGAQSGRESDSVTQSPQCGKF